MEDPDLRYMIHRDITSLHGQDREIHRLHQRLEYSGFLSIVLKVLTLGHFLGILTHQLGKTLSTQ